MTSDWTKPLVAAVLAAIVGGSGGAGGTYALVSWRLDALEQRLAEADSRDQAKLWGAVITRLEAVERRTNDSALTDWVGWRANVDARISTAERALAEDRHGPIWQAIREIREGR